MLETIQNNSIIKYLLIFVITFTSIYIWAAVSNYFQFKKSPGLFNKPSSFSLLIFKGDIKDQVQQIFDILGYNVLGKSTSKSSYFDHYDLLIDGSNTNIKSLKSVFIYKNHTFITDPEIVLSSYDDAITDLCERYKTSAFSAVYERYSDTCQLESYSNDHERQD
jgi:hypothetical protein